MFAGQWSAVTNPDIQGVGQVVRLALFALMAAAWLVIVSRATPSHWP
jgi:hypothetical protein